MTPCPRCRGDKTIVVNLKDLGGRQSHGFGVDHVIVCPACDGEGHVTQAKRDADYRSWPRTPLRVDWSQFSLEALTALLAEYRDRVAATRDSVVAAAIELGINNIDRELTRRDPVEPYRTDSL